MRVNERIEVGRRGRRVLARVFRAAWRLERAERERAWALASARVEGISIRALAAAAGLSPSRVHQLVAAADLDALDAALGDLRAAGWPAPEDPDSDEDTELDGRDHLTDRLADEVGWLRRCVDWLAQLDAGGYPPGVPPRPAGDWPDTANVVVDLARVRAVIDRIAAEDWPSRTWTSGPSAPARECPPPPPRSWSGPGTPGTPNGIGAARPTSGPPTPTTRSGRADHASSPRYGPGHWASTVFRKLDAVAVLTGPLLPTPRVGEQRVHLDIIELPTGVLPQGTDPDAADALPGDDVPSPIHADVSG